MQNFQVEHVIRPHEITDEIMFSTLVSNVLNFFVCASAYVYFYIHSWVKLSFHQLGVGNCQSDLGLEWDLG